MKEGDSMKHIALPVLLICLVIGFVGGFWWSIRCCVNSPQIRYAGTLTFNTTQEYSEFEQFILQPQVEIDKISVLGSQLPIWVKYTVLAPRGFNFSYPYTSSSNAPTSSSLLPAVLLTAFSTAGVIVTAGAIRTAADK